MDEMILSNRKYVTTKRAARVTGYAQDYVGQLIRSGKLKATKVGKAWFVAEDEVLKLAGKQEALEGPDRALAVIESRRTVESSVTFNVEYPKTWTPIHYFRDDSELSPISDKRETIDSNSSIEILDVHRVRIARHGTEPKKQEPVRYASFDGVSFASVSSERKVGVNKAVPTPSEGASDLRLASLEFSSSVPRIVRRESNMAWAGKVLASAVAVSLLVFLVPIVG
jgi:excisionase family DNA binding protein